MKRPIYTLFLLALACSVQAQLLYKISGNGLEKPSYIVGTYHLEDARFVAQIPGANRVVQEVEQVCGELPFEDMLNPDSMAVMTEAMRLPDGQTLKDVLTEKQMKKVNKLTKELFGLSLTNRLLFSQMGQFTPNALSTTFLMMLYMKEKPGRFDPTDGIDNYFQKVAQEAGKPVIGLETIAFQTQVLYHGSPMKEQVKELMQLVAHPGKHVKVMSAVEAIYHDQDLQGLEKLMKKSGDNSVLIGERNANWLTLMPNIMSEHSTLFVVGAGHLPGKKGVLELLRQAGYMVEPVEE